MNKRIKLYPAGKIIHIVHRDEWDEIEIGGFDTQSYTTNTTNTSNTQPNTSNTYNTYNYNHHCLIHHHGDEIAYIADQVTFGEMHISGSMFSTHLPHVCLNKLMEFFPGYI